MMTKARTCRNARGILLAAGAVIAAASAAYAQPANDLCSAPQVVSAGSANAGTNVGATSDLASSSCAFTPTDDLDVWYSFTAASAGLYTFDTEGSTGLTDTTIALFDACGGSELGCNDDGGTGLLSRVSYSMSAGQTVLARVAGWNHGTGAFQMNVSSPIMPTGNDECGSAIAIAPGSSASGDNLGASGTDISSCGFQDTADVWYVLTTTSAGFYAIDTFGTPFDTTLSVFSACGGAELACNDDTNSLQSSVNVQLGAATQAYIRVAGYNGATGTFTLNVGNPVSPPSAPANDNCTGATVIAGLPFADASTDISGATDDADLASCNDAAAVVTPQGVWYSYTPAVSGRFRVHENSTLDTFASVFTGTCAGGFTEVAGGCGRNFVVDGAAGTTYYILVGVDAIGGLPPTAIINLTVEDAPAPANDVCGSAVAISPGSTTLGDNTNATGEDITSCVFGDTGDVWYALTISMAATYVLDTEGTVNLDTALAIFDSCGGSEMACDDDGGTGLLSRIETVLNPGTYLVRVAGFNGGQGAFQLNVSGSVMPPANDACGSAIAITAVPSSVSGTTLGGTSDLASSSCAFTPTDDIDVWYSFMPTVTDYYVFDTEGSTLADTSISAYDNCFGNEVGCDDDSGTGLLSRLNVSLNAGTTYYIRIAGWNHTTGAFTLNVSVGAPPPAGDDCSTAVVVTSPSTTFGDTTTFTSQLAESSCSFFDDIDAWFSFTPASTDLYTIDTVGSTGLFDTSLSIFDACGGVEIACNDDIDLANDNYLSSIETTLNAGTTYYIRVAGFDSLTGAFQLNIAGGGAPSDGACCRGSTCAVDTAANCTGVNTSFAGVGTACNAFGVNNTTPCCLADFNHSGAVSVQDIFDYLSAYFNAAAAADINATGTVTVQDIFDYLSAYFAGC